LVKYLFDTFSPENIGKLADILVQLAISDLSRILGIVALPMESNLGGSLLQMPVQG
jgi:hypothetical protein